MPTTRRTASGSGLPPVPVAIFLPRPHPTRPGHAGPTSDSTWCGMTAPDVAALVAWYTRRRDTVADLDAHPLIAQAASYLGRRPITMATDPTATITPTGLGRRRTARAGLGLLFARLPRDAADNADLHAMTNAIHRCRSLLRPGGYLVAAVIPSAGQLAQRATVITAARTAGLSWRQEFLVLLQPLPEFEPRAMSSTAGATMPVLDNGRHAVNHHKVLAFRRPAGGPNA